MELIQKALAKARAQQSSARSTSQVPGSGSDADDEARHAPVGEPVAPDAQPISRIRYSQTRSVEQSPEHWEVNRLVGGDRNNRIADIFRVLRTKVLTPMRENGWRTLGIVGPTAGVGKSTVAANLALSMAMDGNQTVLLVDLDLRKPRVAEYFGVTPRHGLGDYLEDRVNVEQILVNPGIERLVLLPSTGTHANSSELIASARMQALFNEIRDRYESRMVICDMPPLLASSDSLSFLPRFDSVMLVVEDGACTRDQLAQSRQLLSGSNLIGWVLNKGRIEEHGYYY